MRIVDFGMRAEREAHGTLVVAVLHRVRDERARGAAAGCARRRACRCVRSDAPIVTRAPRTRRVRVAVDDRHLHGASCERGDIRRGRDVRGPCGREAIVVGSPPRAATRSRRAARAPARSSDEPPHASSGTASACTVRALQRAVALLEDHLREEPGHHDAFAEVAEPRLGLLAVRECERELRDSASRRPSAAGSRRRSAG